VTAIIALSFRYMTALLVNTRSGVLARDFR
jgi:hypothetical protein